MRDQRAMAFPADGGDRGSRFWFLLWGNLAMLVALAVARFAFSPLVPAMKDALGYSSGEIGWLGAVHLAGYAVGAATAGPMSQRLGRKRGVVLALGIIALTVALMAATDRFVPHLITRGVTGIASAWAVVVSSSLVLDHAPAGRGGFYLGVVYAAPASASPCPAWLCRC